jgi:hypothetical protein
METNVSFYHFRSCNCGFVFCHDFLKILVEVGEWTKYMEKQILPKTNFPFKSYDKKLVFLQRRGSFFPCRAYKEKNLSFPIREVNFCETFCTCSPSSLGQDLTIKNILKNYFFIWASWARNGSFECFLRKKVSVL